MNTSKLKPCRVCNISPEFNVIWPQDVYDTPKIILTCPECSIKFDCHFAAGIYLGSYQEQAELVVSKEWNDFMTDPGSKEHEPW